VSAYKLHICLIIYSCKIATLDRMNALLVVLAVVVLAVILTAFCVHAYVCDDICTLQLSVSMLAVGVCIFTRARFRLLYITVGESTCT
jgi:hypothetical protein